MLDQYPIRDPLSILANSLGFDGNPFQYTNADQEERLPTYFVPPPYFASVFGNPASPRPFIVYAPRGGGKSAQRRMIERRCVQERVLAITYDEFEFPELSRASEIRLHHHLRAIIRSCLVGVLLTLQEREHFEESLTNSDKKILLQLSAEHLVGTSEIEYEQTLRSLKSLKERFKEGWNEWVPFTGALANVLLGVIKRFAPVDSIDGLREFSIEEYSRSNSLKHQLRLVSNVAQNVGWRAIYILVDRVDEAELTGNSFTDSFRLIEPLLKDLQLLEFDGIGFKFFLWDMLQPLCDKIVRTDRVDQVTLYWEEDLLRKMWRTRLGAFSNEVIADLNQISDEINPLNADELAFIFANHSPRDLIRIGAQVLQEQLEVDAGAMRLSQEAIFRGLDKFSALRASELFTKDRVLKELRRIGQVDFTIPYLANEIFKEKQASTRNRIKIWREQGAIEDLERIVDPSSKRDSRVKLIAIKDIRVAKALYPSMSIPEFLETKYRKCQRCDAAVLRDWGDQDSSGICQECGADLSGSEDAIETWKRQQFANDKRKEYLSETVEMLTQLPLPLKDSE